MSVWGTKRNALLYSQSNDFQLHYGKRLAYTAEIIRGDKVLDMGCGTGELTAFLAGIVGKQAPVVGVDPDKERIELAVQKHCVIHENISFVNGDSSSQFPHRGEEYYDVHFSNFVFQWLNPNEKETFLDTAFKSLKPGGKIAIQSHEGLPVNMSEVAHLFVDDDCKAIGTVQSYVVNKSEIETLLRRAGFTLLYSEYFRSCYTYTTPQDFLTFVCASDYYDDTKISQRTKSDLFKRVVNKDGSVTVCEPTIYQIIGKKAESL